MAEFFKPADGVKRPRNGKRERKTISTSAVGLTSATYTIQQDSAANLYARNDIQPVYALLQVLTNSINFTLDGTTPTASVGYLAAANDLIHLNSFQEIKAFQAIRNGGADGAIEVTYFYGR
jgi:hypothetical protein